MSHDVHIVEDVGSEYSAVHANIGEPTPASDALIEVAITGGLDTVHGLTCPAASTELSDGLAALDTGDPDYQDTADFLTAAVAACDANPAPATFFVNPPV